MERLKELTVIPLPKPKPRPKHEGGQFQKGWRGGPGRPKGAQNGHTNAAKEFARQLVSSKTYRKKLKKDLEARTLEPALEQMLWHYGFGKPKESIEMSWNLERLSEHELDQLEALIKRVS